jgi:hypothetical protein
LCETTSVTWRFLQPFLKRFSRKPIYVPNLDLFTFSTTKLLKFARAAIFTPDMTNSGAVLPRARGTRGFLSVSAQHKSLMRRTSTADGHQGHHAGSSPDCSLLKSQLEPIGMGSDRNKAAQR